MGRVSEVSGVPAGRLPMRAQGSAAPRYTRHRTPSPLTPDARRPTSRSVAAIAFTAAAVVWSCAALAQEQKKQPPPEFSSGYAPPGVTLPGPRAEVFGWIDVAVLALLLVLAAYFGLAKRSRRELRLIALFSVLYFGLYRQGCVCSVGSLQNVALAIFDSGYTLPFVVGAFFVLPLVFALFCGRVFCSGVCPLGALQDLVLLRPRRMAAGLDGALGVLPYVYLGAGVLFAATGSVFVICQYDPFIGFFRMGASSGMVVFGAALLALGVFIGRPYCRYLCPYGVLLRWAAPFARWRVRITPAECVQCHLCADECPFGAITPPAPGDRTESRRDARRRLGRLGLLLPALVLLGALLGRLSSPALARLNPTAALAERVWLEERGQIKGANDASAAYYRIGRPNGELYHRAAGIRRAFDRGAALLGAWVGLVVGLRLIFLAKRRGSADYEADPAACLSCARCYRSCPVEHERMQSPADVRWMERV